MSTSSRLRRSASALVLAATATLGLGACGLNSPVQTDVDYQPGDGSAVTIGKVAVRNLAVVSEAKGGNGTLIGYVANSGLEPVNLVIGWADGSGTPVSVSVPPRGSTTLSTAADKTELTGVPAAPGEWVQIRVNGAPAGDGSLQVPVLTGKDYLEEYVPAKS